MRVSRAIQPPARRAARPSRRRRLARTASVTLAGLTLTLAGLAAHTEMAARAWTAVSAGLASASVDAGLGVARVALQGAERTEGAAVLDALGIEGRTALLAVDPVAARARLRDLPWVRTARVARVFPDTVRVTLTERAPMAVWRRADAPARVIDWRGETVGAVDPARFPELMRVRGDGAPGATPALIRTLQARPALARRVAEARRVAGRRWRVVLRNGVRVELPAERATRAWSRLARLERERRVLQRDIRRIDVRPTDRVVLERGTPEPATRQS